MSIRSQGNAEGAAEGTAHVLHIAPEAVRLVGVGHNAQFELVSFVGVRYSTVHEVAQA